MSRKISNVLLVTKPDLSKKLLSTLENLCLWLSRRKIQVHFLNESTQKIESGLTASTRKKVSFSVFKDVSKKIDLIISLGGDGTLIGLCRSLGHTGIPVFGINMGHLGFITEFNKKDFYDDLNEYIKSSETNIRKIPFYVAKVRRNGKVVFRNNFLNDAVISRTEISRMISASISHKDGHIYDIQGDGIIVSSPSGSTAYSLAANGPIVHPDVDTMLITPICPHGLTHRPLALPGNEEIFIKSPDMSSLLLTLDGQVIFEVEKDDVVVIKRNKKKYLPLVRNTSQNFFQTLKEKFFHGKRYF